MALFWGADHRYRLVNPAYQVTVPTAAGRSSGARCAGVPRDGGEVSAARPRPRGEPAPSTELEVPFGGPEAVEGCATTASRCRRPRARRSPGGILATVVEITEDVARRRDLSASSSASASVAEKLQRALLPAALPDIPGVELCARYEPAGEGASWAATGTTCSRSATARVAVAVGDVAGRGLQAATVMGQLRSALRAYARRPDARRGGRRGWTSSSTGSAAARRSRTGCSTCDDGQLSQALAGHPPPLLVGGAGDGRWLATGSARRSARPAARAGPARSTCPHGGALLYYTDGLLRERELGIRSGMEHLREPRPAGVDGLRARRGVRAAASTPTPTATTTARCSRPARRR